MFVGPEGVLCLATQYRFHDENPQLLLVMPGNQKESNINRLVVRRNSNTVLVTTIFATDPWS